MRPDVALVFPPLWYYPHAPPELTGLTAALRAKQFDVLAFDANREALDLILSSDMIAHLPGGAALAAATESAKASLRTPTGFYDLPGHRRAAATVGDAFRAVSLAHAPWELDLLRLKTPWPIQTLDGCLDAASDPAFPFRRYITEMLVPTVLRQDPRCVALFYVHPEQIVSVVAIARAIRSSGSDAHILVLGSLEDQVNFSRFLRKPEHPDWPRWFDFVDGIVMGDADGALPSLLVSLRAGTAPEASPNIARWAGGRLSVPVRNTSIDPDDSPVPDLSDLPLDRYLFAEPVVAMLAARGCYWGRCTFCAIAGNAPGYRPRSPARVADDMARLHALHRVRWFHFRDMLFSPRWAAALATELIERGIDVNWTCRARFESAWSCATLRHIRASGCRQIWFGFESANARVLAAMDKGTRPAEVSRIVADCADADVGVHLLVLHGFPGETDAEAEETVAWIERHALSLDAASYSNFVMFSDSPVFDNAAALGLKPWDNVGLLQYRFEYLPLPERRRIDARYQVLRARVDAALPMPLLHHAFTSLYRARNGPRSWHVGSP